MQSSDIRRIFVSYFDKQGHRNVPSSSLIPHNDPTVLLTTAGMQQMTPYFLGLEQPPAPRMTSIQKCFRTVDIDDVGDESHCTFFEMLGNFSVGDYFKRDAMRFAWDVLTNEFGIDPSRLSVTIYPEDEEARELWKTEIGLTDDRIFVDPGNIWGPVGDSGPCGPNSEIYVDLGEQFGCGEPDCGPVCERCNRHLEVWNLVFMQWFQEKDRSRRDLERKNIDTGMGLERISAVLQGVPSIYDTDLYQPIMAHAAEIAGVRYGEHAHTDRSLRVIGDHGRAVTFLIADGVLPSNEGRGYVLRRILRRAVRHGRLLGIERPFLTDIATNVIERFGAFYPELVSRSETINRIIRNEEESFSRTLATGMARFETLAAEVQAHNSTVIPGDEAFRLYDTYGFPFELTLEMARDAEMTVDEEGFAAALEQSRARSRQHVAAFADSARERARLYASTTTGAVEFLGYSDSEARATVTDIFGLSTSVQQLDQGQPGEIVLDRTVFYGESGGQVGDTGTITTDTGVFVVSDTQRPTPTLVVHRGEVTEGFIALGQTAHATIDRVRRAAIRRNHTATHVLHRALRMVFGNETHQAGSLVAPDRLRFDFTSSEALGPTGMRRITEIANDVLMQDIDVHTDVMAYADAVALGAMALFGEKYGDVVRVVQIGDFSRELCGGTHVRHTSDIGPIVVLSEASIGSGVRRIEALTGEAALRHLTHVQSVTTDLTRLLHSSVDTLIDDVHGLQQAVRERDRTIEQLRVAAAMSDLDSLLGGVTHVGDVAVLAARVSASDRDTLLQIGDRLREKMQSGVLVLGSVIDDKPALLAMVTRDLTARGMSAGKVIQETAPIIGGRGGGRPEVAQGGGSDAGKLEEALAGVVPVIQRQISA